MLNFLRKHQRIFFVFITTAIVVSFSFFGTHSAVGQQEGAPDREVVKGVCGTSIMSQELTSLCRLIEHSAFDGTSLEKGGMPNLFNDGVIEKDFMSTGLAVMLVKRYFDELKPDLDFRVKKIHHFRPYTHPFSSHISVEGVWSRFAPSLLQHFRALKEKSDQATTETLAMMCQLYLDQAMVSPDILKKILVVQQNQQGVAADPVLANADLSLFGFKPMEEWFGPRFIPLISQFILNTVQIAEKNGYSVKTEEVRADLFQNIFQGYKQISQDDQLAPEDAERYYLQKMRHLGFDEPTLIGTWKKVMLFRRLFEDGSGSVLMDPLSCEQFDQFAKENVKISLYQLPESLQFSDFLSMLKFQIYLESIALDSSWDRTNLSLPRQLASLESVEKKAPELVERQVELAYSHLSKEDLCSKISVKETWEWEFTEVNWLKLKAAFPDIFTTTAQTKEERLAILGKIEEKQRVKIDRFARSQMVEAKKDQIHLDLAAAPMKTEVFGLKKKGNVFTFSGVKEGLELAVLLENAALKSEVPNAANDRLKCYSEDRENYFHIEIVNRDQNKKILTFEEALKNGTLDRMLDRRLEEAYPELRRKNSSQFQNASGQWKPFGQVKDQLGKVFYANLLKAIEEQYCNEFGVLPGKSGELPLSFYSNARMLSFMNEAQRHLQSHLDDPTWIHIGGVDELEELSLQWRLFKSDKIMERCTEVPFSKEGLFTLAPKQWSSVKIGSQGSLAFYFVQEKGGSKLPSLERLNQGHQILSFDAKRDMMLQILQRIKQTESIDLSSFKTVQ